MQHKAAAQMLGIRLHSAIRCSRRKDDIGGFWNDIDDEINQTAEEPIVTRRGRSEKRVDTLRDVQDLDRYFMLGACVACSSSSSWAEGHRRKHG